jgi:hypothetical protein
LGELLDVLNVSDKLDAGFHLAERFQVMSILGHIELFLQLLLARGGVEFYGVAFDHGA